MVHTFEEIRTHTPANPNEAALEASMPQAAWEALYRDAVQGLRLLNPCNPLPVAPDPPPPGMGHWRPSRPPAHPTTTTPDRERARARERQGKGKDTPARGRGEAQGSG